MRFIWQIRAIFGNVYGKKNKSPCRFFVFCMIIVASNKEAAPKCIKSGLPACAFYLFILQTRLKNMNYRLLRIAAPLFLSALIWVGNFALLPTAKAQLTPNWWNSLDDDWKKLFKERHKISANPTAAELTKIYNLDKLDCSESGIRNLEPLRNLTNLKVVWIDKNPSVVSLEPLRSLTKLTEIDFSGTGVSDLEPLRGLVNLTRLECFETNISSLAALSGLRKLKILDFSKTKVNSLFPLKNVLTLEVLYFSQTPVTDLSPLKALANLTELNFSETKVASIDALTAKGKLREIVFARTKVASLAPLFNNRALTIVFCEETGVSKADADALQKKIPTCVVMM